MLPILYSFRRCPYAMRARLALTISRQQYEHREVVLRDKPAALLEASPKGTVPVLVLPDGRVIDQSLDIMLWALDDHDPAGWLTPDQGSLEDMLRLIAQCDDAFKHSLDRYKYPQRYEAEGADPVFHRAQCGGWLDRVEQRLESVVAHEQGGGLFGGRPCLADAAIMPFVRQFAHVDREWFDARPWPALQRWLQGWLASTLFGEIMMRHEPWLETPPPPIDI